MDREKIYLALYAKLEGIDGIKTISRKLSHWSDVQEFPALFLAQGNEDARKPGRGIPIVWTLSPTIYVYIKNEIEQSPSSELNRFLDAVMNALEASPATGNKQTLGGLVEDCYINGQVITDEGVLGQTAVAIIPINIITP